MSMASVARTPSPPFARHRRWSSRVTKSGCSSRPRASAADLSDLAPPVDPCAFVLEAVARATATDHFVISAERVLALAAQRGLDPQDLLPEFVREAQKLAIPPTSKFHVGAAALGASGAVYLGVNVELPGLPLNASIHAEQFAVVTAMRAGERALEAIATTAAAMRVIIPDPGDGATNARSKRHLVLPLCDLLPHSFGPLDLTHDESLPLMLEERHNGLRFIPGLTPEATDELDAAAAALALAEANAAYAPYSASPAGLALVDDDGVIHAGRSVESAAYNPTMSPLHAALVAAVGGAGMGDANGGEWGRIESATLVEMSGAPVQYAGTVALILKTIAPRARLNVIACEKAEPEAS
ncbi:predicted protein [Micromonas commoda]|uniref:CMP/dCMP-type deaminase domain-containing protein n=1 Tax=Micromonas commoda (strain RCC299 / NOUM17 / CCMP2709) TaxID=296587 RepID=C1DYR8_MICCC|nr:predicted protein [Micromonas commoda]ACO61475.1 predicted protein [Micromonas commoda]|eukprot:XP_002500217.1 predicted protein [Micromonas commoda]